MGLDAAWYDFYHGRSCQSLPTWSTTTLEVPSITRCVFIGVVSDSFLLLTAIVKPGIFSYECSAGNPSPSSLLEDFVQTKDLFAPFDATKFTESQNGEVEYRTSNADFCGANAALFAGQNDQSTTSCSSNFLGQQPSVSSNSPDTSHHATPPAVSFLHSRLQSNLITPI